MNKKSLLFIVPSRSSAGTNSSLSGIYNFLKDDYDIEVLCLTSEGNGTYEFLSSSFTIPFINAYFGNYKNLDLKTKVFSIFVKCLKHISIWTRTDIESKLLRFVISRFERNHHFDFVIGFQEGVCTQLAQFFTATKFAWIHSDIDRASKPSKKEESMYSLFQRIVCVSKYTCDKFCKRYQDLRENVLSINNLVDIERIKKLSFLPIDDTRFVSDCFTIVSAGRFDPVKQFSAIPDMARKLLDAGCVFKWYILGGPKNEEYRKVCNAIIDNNVGSNVCLLGNKPNPYPYFSHSDLYVSTSYSEACPMVFREAGILGKPIVTSNFGSSYEFVEEGVNGYIDTIENLWQPVAKMIQDKEAYQRIKLNCETYKIDNELIFEQLQQLFG